VAELLLPSLQVAPLRPIFGVFGARVFFGFVVDEELCRGVFPLLREPRDANIGAGRSSTNARAKLSRRFMGRDSRPVAALVKNDDSFVPKTEQKC
jgi:hypothetical protein